MNKLDLNNMTEQLIASASVSSVNPSFDMGNRALIDMLATWLEDEGFTVTVQPVDKNKANLIARRGYGPAGSGLVLAGHTDTVPYDKTSWDSDPFKLEERDGAWHGLGVSDMKAFIAMAIEAARGFDDKQLQRPLTIVATADEESSMSGAEAILQAGKPLGQYVVIGEPTAMTPVHKHKGVMMEKLHLQGQSGHSSDPSLGNSALEGMHAMIGELLAWRAELQSAHQDHDFAVPVPTLNLGHVHGGDNPNRICAECELHIDLRPLPGMSLQNLRDSMTERLQPVAEQRGLVLDMQSLFDGIAAFANPVDSALVETAQKVSGKTSKAVAFGTEAPYFQQLGSEVIIMGPGDIDVAHQPNECLPLNRIAPAIAQLRELIYAFCVKAS